MAMMVDTGSVHELNLSEDFTEEDVFPFILQFQDVIAKLEGKVVELEMDLETINRKYDRDHSDWLNSMGMKDNQINQLNAKVSRLEFGTKEAILVLADAHAKAGENPKDKQDNVGAKCIQLCLSYLKHLQNESLDDEAEVSRSHLEVHPFASRKASLASIPESTSIDSVTDGDSGSFVKHTETPADLDEEELLHRLEASSNTPPRALSVNTRLASGYTSGMSTPAFSEIDMDFPLSPLTPSLSTDSFYSHRSRRNVQLPVPTPIIVKPASTFCTNCRDLLSQLDTHIEQKAYLKRDMSSLAGTLAQEQETRANIEYAKELLEVEVDEWVSVLFELVNRLIVEEAEAKEFTSTHQGKKLQEKLGSFSDRRDRVFQEMKGILVDLDAAKEKSSLVASANGGGLYGGFGAGISQEDNSTPKRATFRNSLHKRRSNPYATDLNLEGRPSLDLEEPSSMRTSSNYVYIDGIVFSEFQEYVKAILSSAAPATLANTLFMKRILTEDVEPCLFQFSHLAATNGPSWFGKSNWFRRKLLDSISRNACEIMSVTAPNPNASSSTNSSGESNRVSLHLTPNPPKTKCASCGFVRVCDFKIRLDSGRISSKANAVDKASNNWLYIDQFCRDRIVAVCDFFTFLSHLRAGLMHQNNVTTLFRECQALRRRMGAARVGSTSLFREEDERHRKGSDEDRSRRGSKAVSDGSKRSSRSSLLNGVTAPTSRESVDFGGGLVGTVVIVH